jgi:hypothetical protein
MLFIEVMILGLALTGKLLACTTVYRVRTNTRFAAGNQSLIVALLSR